MAVKGYKTIQNDASERTFTMFFAEVHNSRPFLSPHTSIKLA